MLRPKRTKIVFNSNFFSTHAHPAEEYKKSFFCLVLMRNAEGNIEKKFSLIGFRGHIFFSRFIYGHPQWTLLVFLCGPHHECQFRSTIDESST